MQKPADKKQSEGVCAEAGPAAKARPAPESLNREIGWRPYGHAVRPARKPHAVNPSLTASDPRPADHECHQPDIPIYTDIRRTFPAPPPRCKPTYFHSFWRA